ncbi:hypothetical protein ASE77_18765 [Sphingomonas sp. Leaf226]|nr:hypothetical protein ASE77_18765 [Sphingomonas sp. Leaf226]
MHDLARSLIIQLTGFGTKTLLANAPRRAQHMRVMVAIALPFSGVRVGLMDRGVDHDTMAFNQGVGELRNQRPPACVIKISRQCNFKLARNGTVNPDLCRFDRVP